MSADMINAAIAQIREKNPELANAAILELDAMIAALKPLAEFAKTYGPIASALDYPESHILLQVGTAGAEPKAVVVRLMDFYAALGALGEDT